MLTQFDHTFQNGQPNPKLIDTTFHAIDTFCENLEDEIIAHLPALMGRLFESLNPSNSKDLRKLVLGALRTVANAAGSNMLPYFPPLIEALQIYLVKAGNAEVLELRPYAIDMLATLARTIGKETFMPLVSDTMNFARMLLTETEPELKTSVYNLLAALSEVVNAEMGSFLPEIVESMLHSVKSVQGSVPLQVNEDDDCASSKLPLKQ